jgi:hypothetical protein
MFGSLITFTDKIMFSKKDLCAGSVDAGQSPEVWALDFSAISHTCERGGVTAIRGEMPGKGCSKVRFLGVG